MAIGWVLVREEDETMADGGSRCFSHYPTDFQAGVDAGEQMHRPAIRARGVGTLMPNWIRALCWLLGAMVTHHDLVLTEPNYSYVKQQFGGASGVHDAIAVPTTVRGISGSC